MTRPPARATWVGLPAICFMCLLVGLATVKVDQPLALCALAIILVGVLAAVAKWGAFGISLLLLTVTPLIPVVSGVYQQPRSYDGIDGSTLRTVGIAVLSLVALALAHERANDREGRQVTGAPFYTVQLLLIALGLVGVASAVFTATGPSDFVKMLAQSAGQPLFYAIALMMFSDALRRSPEARGQLLSAWCLGSIGEAAIVAGQVATGAAYDPERGFLRAQGTIGADALGAFAMFAVFGALALYADASTDRQRWLARLTVVASLGTLFVSLSRGPLIAFGVALLLLVLPKRGELTQKRIANLAGLALLAAVGLYATKGLWLARLDAPTTGGFDRPATWITGLRLIANHPLVGVGSTHLLALINSSTEYTLTPYGANGQLPHDSWLYLTAANGIFYGVLLVIISVVFARAVFVGRNQLPGTQYLTAGLLGLLLVFFTNNLFNHPEIMLYVLLAAVLVTARPSAIVAAVDDMQPTGSRADPQVRPVLADVWRH